MWDWGPKTRRVTPAEALPRAFLGAGIVWLAVFAGTRADGGETRLPAKAHDVATQVRTLHDRGAEQPLTELARRESPDPWNVVDVLCAEGAFDAARAYAEGAPRPDVTELPAYVAFRRRAVGDAELSRAINEARLHLDGPGGKHAPDLGDRFLRARLLLGGVVPAIRAGRLDDAKTMAEAAERTASDVGWLRGAAHGAHLAGMAELHRGAYRAAAVPWQRELTMHEHRQQPVLVTKSLLNLGNLHTEDAAYEDALAYFARAREAAAELADVRTRDQLTAQVRETEGLVLTELTRFPEALRALHAALDVHERYADRLAIAYASSHLAALHLRLGEFEAAAEAAERALAIFEAMERPEEVASVRANLGNLAVEEGRFEDASALLGEALAHYEARKDRRRAATARLGLALAHRHLGRPAEAVELLESLPAFHEGIGDERARAFALVGLGESLLAAGRGEDAQARLDQALAIAVSAELPYAGFLARVGLARTHGQAGRHREVIRIAMEAASTIGSQVAALSHERSARARAARRDAFELGARSARALGDVESLVHFLESDRAGALLEELDTRDALEHAVLPPHLLAERDRRRAVEAAAWAAYRSALTRGRRREIRAARDTYLEAREQLRRAIERIQGEAKAATPVLDSQPASLEVLAAELDDDEALVLFARIEDALAAVIVRATGATLVELGNYDEAEQAWRATNLDDADTEPEAAIADLEARLVAPLALDHTARRLLIAPVGFLGRVPFTLLVGNRDVAFVPSGTTWQRLRADRALRGRRVLALGDPTYTAAARGAGTTRSMRGPDARALVPLPATRAEAEAVGDVVLLGGEATEENLLRALRSTERWRAVHLACHGLVDDRRPTLSALALTATDEDDGLLTALQVFQTRIASDLVVLSACETGNVGASGDIAGEGLVGLTRAFLAAGAPRVLVSAWPVDDEATAALMKHFYGSWRRGPGTAAAALRAAQAHVRSQEKWRHPRYWAAWLLWGLAD